MYQFLLNFDALAALLNNRIFKYQQDHFNRHIKEIPGFISAKRRYSVHGSLRARLMRTYNREKRRKGRTFGRGEVYT
jgi:hypothetical protein